MFIVANSTNNFNDAEQAGFDIKFIANEDQARQFYNEVLQDGLDDYMFDGNYQITLFKVNTLEALAGFKVTYSENGFVCSNTDGLEILDATEFCPENEKADEDGDGNDE